MADGRKGRSIKVIVTNIYIDGSHGHYIADMLIDGEQKSFKFKTQGEHGLWADDAFHDIFQYARGIRNIFVLIGQYHDGKLIDFPVDMGIILDFSHLLPLGGPEAAGAEDKPTTEDEPKEER